MKTIFAVLACAFSSLALAAPPPAPQVTVAATDIRQLEFNWDPVPGVQSYELWFRSAPGAQWVKVREQSARRAPLFRVGVSVHLLDWKQARYQVAACNLQGCTFSDELGVDGQQLAAMGYFKPKAATGHNFFGGHIAMSADGKTMAVITGETMGSEVDSAVVHVYRKTTATSGWQREARLLPTVIRSITVRPFEGDNLALSADGNTLVFGNWYETPRGAPLPPANQGAVYVFRRTGSTWQLSQKITGDNSDGDWFGFNVKIDDSARTLVIWHRMPGARSERGTLEIYRDPVGGSDQFVHQMTLPRLAPLEPGGFSECDALALSGDGQTLLRACIRGSEEILEGFTYVHAAPTFDVVAKLGLGTRGGIDVNHDGTVVLVESVGGSDVYRQALQGWAHDGFLPLPGMALDSTQLRHVALSRDGKIAVLGNSIEPTLGLGPVYPPYLPGDELTANGAVMVYERRSSSWVLRRLIKPGSTHRGGFGHSVALGDNGRILAVGAPFDPSAATGIDGDRDDASAPNRGAVWLY